MPVWFWAILAALCVCALGAREFHLDMKRRAKMTAREDMEDWENRQ